MKNRSEERQKQPWWVQRWQGLLSEFKLIDAQAILQELARGARVLRLEVAVGMIQATVRDRDAGDCEIRIRLQVPDEAQWESVIDALSSQALFSAQLLAGDMPRQIEELFEQAGVTLLPAAVHELSHECSCCSEQRRLCRPLIATYLALGAMLDDDPWLIFRFRGRERNQVLNELRVRRNRIADSNNGTTRSAIRADAAHAVVCRSRPADAVVHAAVRLDQQIAQYWGTSELLSEFSGHVAAPTIDLALLRRLGPLPVDADSMSAYELLTAIYGQVTAAGLAIAYAPEPANPADPHIE